MLDRSLTIDKLKSSKEYLNEHFGVNSMLLFGSLAAVKAHLQELLGCDVDVVRMRDDMNGVFKRQIIKYGIRVF